MLPVSGVIQRRLLAAGIAAALALAPLSVAAASSSEVDALWNQPDGVSVDSAYYVIQTWWDGLTRATQTDPTQRSLEALTQANTDLLNAYTLLQRQRTDPGPQPVAIIDPLLSSVYNAVTGSNVKAPIGSIFNWANQSLLKLEGRGSTNEIVRSLLQDYAAKQAAAMRDLPSGHADTDALLAANAQRETAFLVTIRSVATPADGLAGLLAAADQSTQAKDNIRDKSKANGGKGQGGNPKGAPQSGKKK
jgi:hypothetical protein